MPKGKKTKQDDGWARYRNYSIAGVLGFLIGLFLGGVIAIIAGLAVIYCGIKYKAYHKNTGNIFIIMGILLILLWFFGL